MAGKSLAMMPWFPRDFIAATRHLALAERGAYRELLDYQWEMGRLPKDPARLARLLGVTAEEFCPIWESIGDKFEDVGAGLANKRLEEHRKKSVEQRDRKVAGANKTNANRHGQRDAERVDERDAKRPDIDPPPSPSPSPSPKKEREAKSATRSRRVPDGYTPDLGYAVAQIPDVDASAEAQKFRDWEFKTPRSDWDAVWRTWISNCKTSDKYARKDKGKWM